VASVNGSGLEFTGERFVPGTLGEIAHEHWHRYAFARGLAAGRGVVDVACGEGYGSALIAQVAREVLGVDIDPRTVAHASERYRAPNLRFAAGSATALPLATGSRDMIVSFETLEHLPREAQAGMIAEFARVLSPDGFLVISSPNRPEYSEARDYRNPFHLHELDRAELAALLASAFPATRWFRQRRYLGSALWSEERREGHEALCGDAHDIALASVPAAMYFVVVAARTQAALPVGTPALSLFSDADDREWARLEAQAREVLRLDALLKARDEALGAQGAHIAHLESLVEYRDRIIVERDAQLADVRLAAQRTATAFESVRGELANATHALASARQASEALEAERQRLERAIAAQERIITYRQSARWWMQLPWLRVRNLWQKVL
jgi:SAM-dependent methyltransferase